VTRPRFLSSSSVAGFYTASQHRNSVAAKKKKKGQPKILQLVHPQNEERLRQLPRKDGGLFTEKITHTSSI
jgi:hypothetical protein